MFSVELEAKVRNGRIEIVIPEEYQQDLREGDAVQLVVLKTEKKFPEDGIIAELTKTPLSSKGIRRLTREEIYEW